MRNSAFRFYKFFISPLLGNNCRYHPSCSDYAREALRRHGLAKGGILAFWRLLRCNPWHEAAKQDPVPERFDWRNVFRYKRL
jgi:putative membrane protein insertion efficiency factor